MDPCCWPVSYCTSLVYQSILTVYRQLDTDIKEDFLLRIGGMFGLERADVNQLYKLLMECMDYRQSVSNVTVDRVPGHRLSLVID